MRRNGPRCSRRASPWVPACRVVRLLGAIAWPRRRRPFAGPRVPSAERRLVERAEFAAVQLRALVVQDFAGADADLEVRGDRFFIEAVRLHGQLEFAVQRLVRTAETGERRGAREGERG